MRKVLICRLQGTCRRPGNSAHAPFSLLKNSSYPCSNSVELSYPLSTPNSSNQLTAATIEAPKEPEKCKLCAATVLQAEERRYQCALCQDALYCSDKCRIGDFASHRAICKGSEGLLAVNEHCAVCTKRIKKFEEHCDKCGSIKYCSTACKDGDKEKHDLICGAFVSLGPRPTKEHCICILFPADEQTPRLVWVPRALDGLAKSEAINNIMAPETQSVEYSAALSVVPSDDVEAYRDVTLCYTGDFAFNPHLSHNKSLGLASVRKPLESVKGPVLVLVSLYTQNEDEEFVGKMTDAIPGDLPKVLEHFARSEHLHGLDPSQRIALMLEETQLGDSDSERSDGEGEQSSDCEGEDADDLEGAKDSEGENDADGRN